MQTLNIVTPLPAPDEDMWKRVKSELAANPTAHHDDVKRAPAATSSWVTAAILSEETLPSLPVHVGLHKVVVVLEMPQRLVVYLRLASAQENHPHLTSAPITAHDGTVVDANLYSLKNVRMFQDNSTLEQKKELWLMSSWKWSDYQVPKGLLPQVEMKNFSYFSFQTGSMSTFIVSHEMGYFYISDNSASQTLRQ